MNKEITFIIYRSALEDVSVDAIIKDNTIWLNQQAMAEVFDCTTDNVSLHLKNIYTEGELNELATTEDFSVVQQEGSRQVQRKKKFCNLEQKSSEGDSDE